MVQIIVISESYIVRENMYLDTLRDTSDVFILYTKDRDSLSLTSTLPFTIKLQEGNWT